MEPATYGWLASIIFEAMRIKTYYRAISCYKKTWLRKSKQVVLMTPPAPLPPKVRYKAIIHDILHRRWRALGIKVNQKILVEKDMGTEFSKTSSNINQNDVELNNDAIENEDSSSDDDEDVRETDPSILMPVEMTMMMS